MSKIALSGDASGTGTFTIASPNSNSNFTLTLPAETGTIVTTATTTGISASALTTGTIPKARMYAGAVLQVVQGRTTTNTSSSSTTYVDATGFSATITPLSTSSSVLVLVDLSFYIQADNSTRGGVRILRDATVIYTDDNAVYDGVNANVGYGTHMILSYLDSPATSSATTYKIQIRRTSTAGTSYPFQVNANSQGSSITLMEIAG